MDADSLESVANMKEQTDIHRYRTIANVNWVCTIVDFFLTVLKLVVGFLAKSPALIADGFHSLSDLATDILALILGNLAKHGPDEDHPYGHARYETMGTVILGATLIAVALGIGYENITALLADDPIAPQWITLIVVALSILSKEALFFYTMHYAKLTRSKLLEANAWHSRSDSLSSVAVLFGVAGAMAGFSAAEYIAAILVAVLIGNMGVSLTWNASQDLIDRGVKPEKVNHYQQTLLDISGIENVHDVRTRLMANDVFIDAHIQVGPQITVSEAHQINDYAAATLKTRHEEIKDVTLHIDFEADNCRPKTTLMPVRNQLEALLKETPLADYEQLYLHYRGSQVTVELMYKTPLGHQEKDSAEALVKSHDWIASITLGQWV